MDEEKKPVVVYQTGEHAAAAMMQSLLEASGIMCRMLDSAVNSTAGYSTAAIGVRLLVPASQAEEALAIIADAGEGTAPEPEKSPDHSAKVVAFYDGMAEQYTRIADSVKYGVPAWLDSRLSCVPVSAPAVLDLGCANGYLGLVVRKRFSACRLTGADISPKMIEELKKTGIYQETHVCDLSHGLPFIKEGAFDIVLAIGFLEFIDEPAALFGDISRALKPGGRCFASFELFDAARHAAMTVDNPVANFPRYLRTRGEIAELAKSSGLRVISDESIAAYTSPVTGERRDYQVLTFEK